MTAKGVSPFNVVIMYVDVSKSKTYTRVLLRESFREDGKVKKRTIANISHCPPEQIEALKVALKNPAAVIAQSKASRKKSATSVVQGKSVGAAFTLAHVADQIGLTKALGSDHQANLATYQVFARLIEQGSRLSAVRLHQHHALAEAIGFTEGFDEEALYRNLSWLDEQQESIEDTLFEQRVKSTKPVSLFLYDVTSSYLEGKHNELAAYGYNRDKKKGKMQIVIGLLCDDTGLPVSVQVFPGNTPDVNTFGDQVKKVADRFGCKSITFVGDRGMIKTAGKETVEEHGFHYITALTKKQIETLENKDVIQLDLFDNELCEVSDEGKRYILRRNSQREAEIRSNRIDKQNSIESYVTEKNKYLKEHPKAKPEKALEHVLEKIDKLNCKWLEAEVIGEQIALKVDSVKLEKLERYDGCYVITTDLPESEVTKEQAHAHYKSLSKVERAFHDCKTGHLELRPIHVRTKSHTHGHVFVVMLAYLIRCRLEQAWRHLDITVEEGISVLSSLSAVTICETPGLAVEKIPEPSGVTKQLLEALECKLPEKFVSTQLDVDTRKKLKKEG